MTKLQRDYNNSVLQFFSSNSIPIFDSIESSLFQETLNQFCPEHLRSIVLGFFYSNMYGFNGLYFVLGLQYEEDYVFLKRRLNEGIVYGYVYNFDCPEFSECGSIYL